MSLLGRVYPVVITSYSIHYTKLYDLILGAWYMLWLYQRIFFNEVKESMHGLAQLNLREILTLVPMVLLIFWIGLYPNALLSFMHTSVTHLIQQVQGGATLAGPVLSSSLTVITSYSIHYTKLYECLGFFVFFVSMLAETNRVPFDLPEAETELVSGYCTEYSGMRYAIFFMAEYIGMMVMASIATICFLGGWNGPFAVPLFPPLWFVLKVYLFMFLFIWIRATLPRYRYDQLMDLGWKLLIPLALANIVLTACFRTILA